ncbi:MAG: efflux RND transporter permease subunit, partial [Leptospiraceae bacterium]|nr:efflux RND transporter permease subunit [Leptospiraceae bacterium]
MERNWTGRVAAIFVNNGRLSLLILFTLFIWGGISYFTTPKQYNPRIVAPAFQIVVDFPGAERSEVVEQVTRPLEDTVLDIPGVEDVYSVSMPGGRSIVNVNFFVGEDANAAKITLNDRLQSNMDLSPIGAQGPFIRSIDPDDVPVIQIGLKSTEVGPVDLRKFAYRLTERLTTVPGARNIEVVGGRKRELAIRFDPNRLRKENVGIGQIQQALQRSNVYLPSGDIKTADRYIPLEVKSVVSKPEDLENIVVVTGDFGQTRLKDVATVVETVEEIDSHVRLVRKGPDGKIVTEDAGVIISIAKLEDANITDVTEAIRMELNKLHSTFIPDNIKTNVIVNEGKTAHNEIMGLVSNLITAIVIVVVVLLLFLDVRAAMLVAISIPLTLATVFGVAQFSGLTINRITLFALILSLGLLVDNATVVIENVVRRIRMAGADEESGETRNLAVQERKEIIVDAVAEVGPGLFMATVTTVLAFIPMAFVTGMMGPYMGPIPFFVPAAIIIALMLSYSLNPWMASLILRGPAASSGPSLVERLPGKLSDYILSAIDFSKSLFRGYQTYLHRLLIDRKVRRISLSIIGIALLASLALPAITLVKFRMLPKADREQFFLYVDLPAGTSLEKTNEVTQILERRLMKHPEIIELQSYTGRAPILDFNGLFRGVDARRQPWQSTIRVGLTEPDSRNRKSEEIVLKLRPEILKEVPTLIPDVPVKLKFVEDPPGPPVRSTLLVRVQGYDDELMQEVTKKLYPRIKEVNEVVDMDLSIPEDRTTISLKVDHAAATRRRVAPAQVVQALRTAYSGTVLGIYHNSNNIEQEYIVLRMDRSYRDSVPDIMSISLFNDLGIKVSLGDMVRVVEEPAIIPLERENRLDSFYILGDMGDRSITYAAIDILYIL